MHKNLYLFQGYTCAMVDSCPPHLSGDEVYNMLIHNFKRHYNTNRAPYGLYFHTTWFKKPEYLAAFRVRAISLIHSAFK
jgi:hypothetical protein